MAAPSALQQDVLLAATDKAAVHVLDATSGASLYALKDGRPCTNGLCATGGFALTAEKNRSFIHAWSWQKEQPRFRCQAPERVCCLTCTADGAHCVGGGLSGKLYLWQVASGRLLLAWDAHFKPPTALACSLCDGYLLSAGEDAIVLAWSFAELLDAAHAHHVSPRPFRTWTDHTLPISALCVAPCGQHDLIGSAAADQTIRLWRLSDAVRGCIYAADLPAALTCLSAHPRHSCLYAGGAGGELFALPLLLDAITDAALLSAATSATSASLPIAGKLRTASASRAGPVRGVCATSDGARVVTVAAEPGVRVWDARSLALLFHFQPTMVIESLVLMRRPEGLRPAERSAAAEEAAAANASASAAAAACFNLAPLKKFAEPPLADGGLEAAPRAMGCVPCDVRAFNGRGGHAPGAQLLHLDADEALLPLLGGEVRGEAAASVVSAGGEDTLGGAMEPATAEATVRQLRGQLERMQQINRELYEMAVDATIGAAALAAVKK